MKLAATAAAPGLATGATGLAGTAGVGGDPARVGSSSRAMGEGRLDGVRSIMRPISSRSGSMPPGESLQTCVTYAFTLAWVSGRP